MKKLNIICLFISCLLLITACGNGNNGEQNTEGSTEGNEEGMNLDMSITNEIPYATVNPDYQLVEVDGNTINPYNAFRGLGAITGNNSSRLLMDYKELNPDDYWEMMNLLFKPGYGAGITHVKLEFGTDVNSSSGTEPSTMRFEDETANVRRGAGFMFAADAKSINPDITVNMLRWGEPQWVTNAFDVSLEAGHEARYKWYKETIDAAYDEYGLKFDFMSADGNEPANVDVEWIIYFANRLKSEPDSRYDYSEILIVASDQVGSWDIANEMMKNEDLRNVVDILGVHYNTDSSTDAKTLNQEYGKELWYSEGIAPITMPRLAVNSNGSGLGGINGALDVCNRIINAYYRGSMVSYQYQPAIAGYYSGAKFNPKALIHAPEPWSGFFEADVGIWTSAHFTAFMKKGWQYVDSACFGDGTERNHAISETTNNYMTTTDPNTGDYSIVISNDSNEFRNYTFTVSNLDKAGANIHVWETADPNAGEAYYENWLRNIATYKPVDNGDGTYSYSISVKPFSLVTITTLEADIISQRNGFAFSSQSAVLPLPYYDDFNYSDEFIERRAGAPLFSTDQGGAFEVVKVDGESVLMQIITAETKPTDWRLRGTPNPITSLGDDRWSDYSASINFKFDEAAGDGNYVSFGVRYLSSEIFSNSAEFGYSIRVFPNGDWQLRRNDRTIESGSLSGFNITQSHEIKITAVNNTITAYINGEQIAEYNDDGNIINSGRVSIGSGYFNNYFYDLAVEPIGEVYYITRIDDLEGTISYQGEWENEVPKSFNEFNRTLSTGETGTSFTFEFTGTELAIIGRSAAAEIEVTITNSNGESEVIATDVIATSSRHTSFKKTELERDSYTVTVKVINGAYSVDVIETK
jgi:hypothetical protein